LAPDVSARPAPWGDGTASREFRIAGIYEPTPDPQRLGQVPRELRMHLPDLLQVTHPHGTLTGAEACKGINVRLKNPADARAFSKAVQAAMPGVLAVPATESMPPGPFRVLERFHLAIAIVTI